jgi:hypothetical protein
MKTQNGTNAPVRHAARAQEDNYYYMIKLCIGDMNTQHGANVWAVQKYAFLDDFTMKCTQQNAREDRL